MLFRKKKNTTVDNSKSNGDNYNVSKFSDTSKYFAIAKEVKEKVEEYNNISIFDFSLLTLNFKTRYEETNDQKELIGAAAIFVIASKHVFGFELFNSQIASAFAVNDSYAAEIKTGEGKTLITGFAAFLNYIQGYAVHVVTANEYLVERDAKEVDSVISLLGVDVAWNLSDHESEQKKKSYKADILYSSNSELAFDYLRDTIADSSESKVQGPLESVIIDEFDSILIDDANSPLIISGPGTPKSIYYIVDNFINILNENDYNLDPKDQSIMLVESGIEKAEHFFKIKNLFDQEYNNLILAINNCLKAHKTLFLNVDYLVKEEKIELIDKNTGRMLEGRQFSSGLHQAIEAKEGLAISTENVSLTTITYQGYFGKYKKMSGMSGTIITQAYEINDIYKLKTLSMPTNRPLQRQELPDKVFGTNLEKLNAVTLKVATLQKIGQPVLVVTQDIETNEKISQLFTKSGIEHKILTAKELGNEADTISNAGQKGAVTVATNVAGRGTDIKLGEGVRELGGLYAIGIDHANSVRVDDQLRGRAGRQGDVGVAEFYMSLDAKIFNNLTDDERDRFLKDKAANNYTDMPRLVRKIQDRIDNNGYGTRSNLFKYDLLLNQIRDLVIQIRNDVLDSDSKLELFESLLFTYIEENFNDLDNTIGYLAIYKFLQEDLLLSDGIIKQILPTMEKININILVSNIMNYFGGLFQKNEGAIETLLSNVFLKIIDISYVDFQTYAETVKDQSNFSSYSQKDPYIDFKNNVNQLYQEIRGTIQIKIIRSVIYNLTNLG